jgi:hypothetical protein
MMFGDFDLQGLYAVNPLSIILFLLFMVMMFLTVVNIFIAIINYSYDDAVAKAEKGFFRDIFGIIVLKLLSRISDGLEQLRDKQLAADELQAKLSEADEDGNFGLSADEVADFISAGGGQMIDLIQQFDVNRDGVLDELEMLELNNYLEEQVKGMPPKVKDHVDSGIGGYMAMSFFRKGKLTLEKEKAEKNEKTDKRIRKRLIKVNSKVDKLETFLKGTTDEDVRANSLLRMVLMDQRQIRNKLIEMDSSLSSCFNLESDAKVDEKLKHHPASEEGDEAA